MGLETGTYISDLNAANPTSSDAKSQGDDHLRLIKSTVKNTFPNVSGAVTPTHTELNYVDGVTSAIQAQLDAKAPLASPALTGTPTAPTAAAGTNTTQVATTAFVTTAAFSSALPSQTGNTGKFVTTDGTTASWADAVTPTGTQTLTNKTLTTPVISSISNTGTLTLPTSTDTLVGRSTTDTLTNKTLVDPVITGTILEDIFAITDGAAFEIDPGNGSIQTITLGASRTPKATNFAAGESVTLMVDDGTAYSITWTDSTFGGSGVVWKTDSGAAPTLNTSGYTVIVLWKVGTQVYGARVGNA